MNNLDRQLYEINKTEAKVRVAERNLRAAQNELDRVLTMTESLFQNEEECVIEVFENGKWKMVGLDRDDPKGWSTDPTGSFKCFSDENHARKSRIYRDLLSDPTKEEGIDYRINSQDGTQHRLDTLGF